MGDDKKNEELEDVSGGPDTVAPIITDALEDVDGRDGVPREPGDKSLEDVEGGEFINGGAWTGT